MRKPILFAVAVAATAATALPAVAAPTVNVGDNYFVRATGVPTVSVARGSKVTFRWVGRRTHNVKGLGINLGTNCGLRRSSGTCLTPALSRAGTYTVYCQVHGLTDQRMSLRVR